MTVLPAMEAHISNVHLTAAGVWRVEYTHMVSGAPSRSFNDSHATRVEALRALASILEAAAEVDKSTVREK